MHWLNDYCFNSSGGIFVMLLFWLPVLIFIYWIFRNGKDSIGRKENDPIDILKTRLAKGEIDKKEFDEKKKILEK
jgi:putative membrane protein